MGLLIHQVLERTALHFGARSTFRHLPICLASTQSCIYGVSVSSHHFKCVHQHHMSQILERVPPGMGAANRLNKLKEIAREFVAGFIILIYRERCSYESK